MKLSIFLIIDLNYLDFNTDFGFYLPFGNVLKIKNTFEKGCCSSPCSVFHAEDSLSGQVTDDWKHPGEVQGGEAIHACGVDCE